MRKVGSIVIICLVFCTILTLAQDTLPNGSFEYWSQRNLYDKPTDWTTSNQITTMLGNTSALPADISYQGSHALRLETADTIAGYAFSNGTILEGNIGGDIVFRGGFPISGAPTSLSGFFRCNTFFLNPATVLLFFKKDGVTIGQKVHPFLFTYESWTKEEISIDAMTDVPDSAFIAIVSANPEDPRPTNWIEIDSLWFNGIADPIPNGNFENWESQGFEDPDSWLTSNLFSSLFGGGISASPSIDAVDGTYALRLEAINTIIPDDDGMRTTNLGYLLPYADNALIGEELPSFPISINPTGLSGYYKFSPQGNDTAMLQITLTTQSDTQLVFTDFLPPAADYTSFLLDFDYGNIQENIVAIRVLANTSKYFDTSLRQQGNAGSVLFLDQLELIDGCSNWSSGVEITVDSWPSCDDSLVVLDAGAGWDSYSWSTGETTQHITYTVNPNEEDTVSVLVTSPTSWCFYEDLHIFHPPDNCSPTNLKVQTLQDIFAYPIPFRSELTIESQHVSDENYQVQLWSMDNKIVFNQEWKNADNNKLQLDFTHIPKGVYHLSIAGKLHSFQQCILKY